mgnify:CR=1 FL=1
MSELNKYSELPDVLMPKIVDQCAQRVATLKDVISKNEEVLRAAMEGVYTQLEEAQKDLEDAELRIGK